MYSRWVEFRWKMMNRIHKHSEITIVMIICQSKQVQMIELSLGYMDWLTVGDRSNSNNNVPQTYIIIG